MLLSRYLPFDSLNVSKPLFWKSVSSLLIQVLIIGSEKNKMASEGSSGDVSLEVEEKEEQNEISNIDELTMGMLLEAKDKFGNW